MTLPRLLTPGRLLVLAGAALLAVALVPPAAPAQEKDAAPPADPPPAAAPAGGAAPAADAAAPAASPPRRKNIIIHIFESLGWAFAPLLLVVSVSLVALIVLLFLDLRMANAIPAGFVDEFTDTVNKRRFKEAFDLARNDPSFLGRVLSAGMSRLQYGLDDAREAANNTLEAIRSDKEQKNNYTAVIASLGPMLGLVGTVYGMIESFMVLGATQKTANANELADGISHALAVTLVGIAISVPAIFFNAFFRNRITKVTMDVGHVADDLLTQMYHNSKKTAAPAPPPAAPPK